MKYAKKWLSVLLVWALLAGLAVPAAGAQDRLQPSLRVTTGSAARGDLVTVQVRLEHNTKGVCGGSLNVEYDPGSLKLEEAAGARIPDTLISVNERYGTGVIRATIAGTAPLPENGTLLTLTFRVSKAAALGDTALTLSDTVLYDEQVQKQPHDLEHGKVTVQYAMLRVEKTESMPMQSVQVRVTLDGALRPTGGMFTVRYDPTHLQARSVVSGPLAQGRFLNGNVNVPGEVKISWAGTQPVDGTGTLCIIVFSVRPVAAGELPLQLQQVQLYNEQGKPLETLTEDGSIRMREPTEESPKLWVVGGRVDEAGDAEVAVVLEGRGRVSGGAWTLTYESETCELTAIEDRSAQLGAIGVINSPLSPEKPTPAGTIRFSWASAAPSVEAQSLLIMKFHTTAVGGSLDLSQVRLLDGDGQNIVQTDLRCGKIRPADMVLQVPVIDDVVIESGAQQTQALFSVDVASAKLTDAGNGQGLRAMVAFYRDGRMQTTEVPIDASDLLVRDGGTLSVTIRAHAEGEADAIKVFLLSEDGSMLPLTEASLIPVP